MEKNSEEEEKESANTEAKDDFLKKIELLQKGLDKKMEKMQTEKENSEKDSPIFVNATRSVDLGQPKISLNSYRAGLKKNLLSINPEAEKLMNMPKKILTPCSI